MREIKFRAWAVENKAYIAGFNLINFHDYYTKGQPKILQRYSSEWKDDEFILEQYAGLKDKNGVEIYEGDILRHFVDFGPAGEHGGHTTAVEITPFGLNIQMWIFEEDGYLPEIIANIHEDAPCSK